LAYSIDCFDSGGTPTVHFFLNSQTQKRRRENPREAAKPELTTCWILPVM
jgi:hypothetical protein